MKKDNTDSGSAFSLEDYPANMQVCLVLFDRFER
jgi:hypothetical protein